jgi:hypothetical protein
MFSRLEYISLFFCICYTASKSHFQFLSLYLKEICHSVIIIITSAELSHQDLYQSLTVYS